MKNITQSIAGNLKDFTRWKHPIVRTLDAATLSSKILEAGKFLSIWPEVGVRSAMSRGMCIGFTEPENIINPLRKPMEYQYQGQTISTFMEPKEHNIVVTVGSYLWCKVLLLEPKISTVEVEDQALRIARVIMGAQPVSMNNVDLVPISKETKANTKEIVRIRLSRDAEPTVKTIDVIIDILSSEIVIGTSSIPTVKAVLSLFENVLGNESEEEVLQLTAPVASIFDGDTEEAKTSSDKERTEFVPAEETVLTTVERLVGTGDDDFYIALTEKTAQVMLDIWEEHATELPQQILSEVKQNKMAVWKVLGFAPNELALFQIRQFIMSGIIVHNRDLLEDVQSKINSAAAGRSKSSKELSETDRVRAMLNAKLLSYVLAESETLDSLTVTTVTVRRTDPRGDGVYTLDLSSSNSSLDSINQTILESILGYPQARIEARSVDGCLPTKMDVTLPVHAVDICAKIQVNKIVLGRVIGGDKDAKLIPENALISMDEIMERFENTMRIHTDAAFTVRNVLMEGFLVALAVGLAQRTIAAIG